MKDELDTIKEIHENYSCLKNVPLVNDEADPVKSWWKDFIWRAGDRVVNEISINSQRVHNRAKVAMCYKFA